MQHPGSYRRRGVRAVRFSGTLNGIEDMAYALIHFLEGSDPKVTVVRTTHGQPTGDDGVMNLLGAFINEWSSTVAREGSPGAVHMAMLFVAREVEAGREARVLGGDEPLGITAEEVQALEGQGYSYEVSFGRAGERTLPTARSRAIERPQPAE